VSEQPKSQPKPQARPQPVDDEDSVLHAKMDAAVAAVAVSRDLFDRVDDKLSGVLGKIRKLERLVLVLGLLVAANLALTSAVILVLVGRP
jgi:hypothetical protein